MKFNDSLKKSIMADLKADVIPMLIGEPGIGKSSWVEDLAKDMHTQCFVLPCNQLADKADLTGSRLVKVDKSQTANSCDYETQFYPHTVINQAIAYADDNPRETPILFLDELNRTTPDVTSEALSIPTLRSIGDRKLPKNLRVITAGNDKGNITSLDQASITRFVLYHVAPDIDTFLSVNPELNPYISDVLKVHPECLLEKPLPTTVGVATKKDDDDDDDINNFNAYDIADDGECMEQMTTPRTITGLSKKLNNLDDSDIRDWIQETEIDPDTKETRNTLTSIILAHTGNTKFSWYLIEAITNAMATSQARQANVFTMPKPQCYDDLKKFNDTAALEQYIKNLSSRDKSGCLAYSIFEKVDNSKLIPILLENMDIDELDKDDWSRIISGIVNNHMDEGNMDTLKHTHHEVANRIQMLGI